jgi:Xaa-Pro aminopeptidase
VSVTSALLLILDSVDILARRPLWQDGKDYAHGTGHGIGSFLTVHEGPCRIANSTAPDTPLLPGHILSNEPGYYEESHFGIRIESAILVKKLDTISTHSQDWLGFERLTRVPIQASLVDFKLLSKAEAQWLKAHNDLCKSVLLPELNRLKDRRAIKWLKSQ